MLLFINKIKKSSNFVVYLEKIKITIFANDKSFRYCQQKDHQYDGRRRL
jgi:hypothetical protein